MDRPYRPGRATEAQAGRRARQGVERNVVVTSWEWGTEKTFLHDLISSDRPFCKKGSDHPSAKLFPLDQSGRQVSMLDPKTMKYHNLDTCFGTHHPQFGYDADNTLWLTGTGPVAGWVNTKVWDETGDAVKAQGWRRKGHLDVTGIP